MLHNTRCMSSMEYLLQYAAFELSFVIILQFLSPHAIAVRTPLSPRPGEVDITLVYKGSQFCINNPGKFVYISKSVYCCMCSVFTPIEFSIGIQYPLVEGYYSLFYY